MFKKTIIENLYKIPKKEKAENAPKIIVEQPNFVHQADVLFMPNDGGFKYILVVADCGSKLVDAEPLKTHSSKEVAQAFGTIYSRGILTIPKGHIEVDSGSEFKGATLTYFKNKELRMRVAMTDRHRQQGIVERANQTIAKLLFRRMTAIEILTGEKNTEWVEELPNVIKQMNEIAKKRPKPKYTDKVVGKHKPLLINQQVRVKLDHPIENVKDERVYGKFRVTDVRWNREVRTIMRVLIKPNYPIMYLLNDPKNPSKELHVAYTREQLQVIPENEAYPNAKKLLKDKKPSEYLVEKITGHRMKGRELLLKVRWAGYSAKDDTWESAKRLMEDMPEMVKEYLKINKLVK